MWCLQYVPMEVSNNDCALTLTQRPFGYWGWCFKMLTDWHGPQDQGWENEGGLERFRLEKSAVAPWLNSWERKREGLTGWHRMVGTLEREIKWDVSRDMTEMNVSDSDWGSECELFRVTRLFKVADCVIRISIVVLQSRPVQPCTSKRRKSPCK